MLGKSCDGDGPCDSGERRLYPVGRFRLLLCRRCWKHQNAVNAEMGRAQENWEDAEVA